MVCKTGLVFASPINVDSIMLTFLLDSFSRVLRRACLFLTISIVNVFIEKKQYLEVSLNIEMAFIVYQKMR